MSFPRNNDELHEQILESNRNFEIARENGRIDFARKLLLRKKYVHDDKSDLAIQHAEAGKGHLRGLEPNGPLIEKLK